MIKPTTVEDAREITETLLANRTVVLNLEGLDVDIAQRIIDFTSGSCFAISGNLQKISHYIFIITPASVDISGDFQDILSGSFDVPIDQRFLRIERAGARFFMHTQVYDNIRRKKRYGEPNDDQL